jgi:hypothetical protein
VQLEETLPLLLGACAAGWSIMTGVVQDEMVGWMQTHVIRLQAQVCSKRGSNPLTFVDGSGSDHTTRIPEIPMAPLHVNAGKRLQ